MRAWHYFIGATYLALAVLIWTGEITLWPLLGGLLCADFGVRRIWRAITE